MLFSSNLFLFFFLPVILLVYFSAPRVLRNPILLIFSLLFYGWGEPVYLLLMVGCILLNYLGGYWIHVEQKKGRTGKVALIVTVSMNLLLLGYFKYANFLFGSLLPEIALPLGISFYIFQSMSYIIDVYRGSVPIQKNPLLFGTYVTLFPQLIAGPIVRYADVKKELEERTENIPQFADGVRLFIIGLSKKVLIANVTGNLWNLLQAEHGTLAAWFGLFAYALQIYFDFSGYSDMAIGLGKMFGFNFLKNFNYPYISKSITEFWSRWHISLSSWFKEYVYIPLGGNRKGIGRQLLNILIVWLLTGLWHGANWNFVLWGLYFAIILIIEKLFLKKVLQRLPSFVSWLYMLFIVMLSWVLFYFEDITDMAAFFTRMFSFVPSQDAMPLIIGYLPTMVIAAICTTPLLTHLTAKYKSTAWLRTCQMIILALLFILCVSSLVSQSYNPFIYFRF